MSCVKTGCNVYLTQYNIYLHGDAFREGNLLIIRSTPYEYYVKKDFMLEIDFAIDSIVQWFDRHTDNTSTLIANEWR